MLVTEATISTFFSLVFREPACKKNYSISPPLRCVYLFESKYASSVFYYPFCGCLCCFPHKFEQRHVLDTSRHSIITFKVLPFFLLSLYLLNSLTYPVRLWWEVFWSKISSILYENLYTLYCSVWTKRIKFEACPARLLKMDP